jgi:hypothetical protein
MYPRVTELAQWWWERPFLTAHPAELPLLHVPMMLHVLLQGLLANAGSTVLQGSCCAALVMSVQCGMRPLLTTEVLQAVVIF